MILFSSDWHLGHRAILKYRDGFDSIEEHDNHIFDRLSKLSKRDIVHVIGDSIFDGDNYDFYISKLAQMSCRIKLVMGNHDAMKLYKENRLTNLEIQLPLYSYKNIWVSHCPIHPQEIRGRLGNIHGHLHKAELGDPRYFEVGLDQNNYEFVDFEEIREYFNSLEKLKG